MPILPGGSCGSDLPWSLLVVRWAFGSGVLDLENLFLLLPVRMDPRFSRAAIASSISRRCFLSLVRIRSMSTEHISKSHYLCMCWREM